MPPATMRIGTHVSIAGGISRAVDRAQALEVGAFQVFVKSARQWSGPPHAQAEQAAFRRRTREAGLERHVLAHGSYLINLASPDAALRRRSATALADELGRCAELEIPALVLHPGSPRESGPEVGVRRIAAGLDRVLRRASAETRVLLEVTAGQGSNLGHRFEQLAAILGRMKHAERVGCCLDTCHLLAAGYEFRDRPSYRALMRQFDDEIGLDRLLAFHLNDSRHPIGSRRDRHASIGRGEVGLEAFRLILADRRLRGIPMVLETPKGDDGNEDRRNLAVLRWMSGRRARR